jgi:hypothetical protein
MPPLTGLGHVANAILQICRAAGAQKSRRQVFQGGIALVMFILDQLSFANNEFGNIDSFVNNWSRFYNETPGDTNGNPINYLDELNLNADLTIGNIQRLLRWKSPRHLTHENQEGEQNEKVQRVIQGIGTINSFRRGEVTEGDFLGFTANVFQNGFVYRAFLFHIARPADYPIWDQHVARVHALLTHRENSVNWQHYTDYRVWFTILKTALNISDELTLENIGSTKRLDDALMAYGQFLAKYNDHQVRQQL